MLSESRRQAIRSHLGILEAGRRIGPDAKSDMLADDLRDLLAALTEAEQQRDKYARLLSDLEVIFTSTPKEIARAFGESRCVDDSARINYALELMDGVLAGTAQEQTP